MFRYIRFPLLTLAMTLFLVFVESSSVLAGQWGPAGIPLAINEFMASNTNTTQDAQGQYDDWVEIHNYGIDAIDTGGMYLTDDLSEPAKWQIPGNNPAATVIPPGGYLLIWADNDTGDAGLHANFKLDADGEEIGLFDSDGITLIDSVIFGQQTSDISYGRHPDAGENWQPFAFPSPAAENVGVYEGFVSDVEFSFERGFYDAPFSLTLATETEDAVIYYSFDGSDPYESTPRGRSSGIAYTGPIAISRTTCLRAVATKTGYKPSDMSTQTYIFVSDVVRQSRTGQAPGSGWPTGSVNGQTINYGMDPDVVDAPRYSRLMDDALLAIPSISLVTDLGNLFNSSQGIYVNARRTGRDWERPASAELLYPDNSEGFQIDAGLRIRGAFSRSGSNPKHAFRLLFRPQYGQSRLRFPLFDDEGVDEFENVDLRTSQNYSWSYQGDSSNTMVREVFSRDVQRDMGRLYTRSRYYHLYLNGHYWGLFQTQERSEASYAESYLGGDKEDYDVIKSRGGNPNYTIEATDGNLDAWRRLWEAAGVGFNNDADYYRVQGMNPDGTRNPRYERLLDIDNLIDYMICTYYVGDPDGPVSAWGRVPNNFYGIYNREDPDGFKFFRHDGEHSLRSLYEDRLFAATTIAVGGQFNQSNPLWVHVQLIANQRYRMRFADCVFKHFFNDGLLTPDASVARVMARVNQIDLAIIAESARWGDSKRSSPFTKDDHWQPEINRILYNYLPSRTSVVLGQFRDAGWYPNVDAPVFRVNNSYQHGGQIGQGDTLSMTAATGTIWYTLDGSDPRRPGASDGVSVTLVPENADKRVFVPTRSIGDTWRNSTTFSDRTWLECIGSPGGIGYERSSGYGPLITLDLEGQMYARNTSCYIRIPFAYGNSPDDFGSLTLRIRYDDGFVAYLNGIEVARRNFSGTPAWNSNASASHSDSAAVQFESIDISASSSTLRRGENLLAIQGLNTSTTSSDLLISVELSADKGGSSGGGGVLPNALQYTGPITLPHSSRVKASVLSGRTWSALNETVFAIGSVAENLRITEIMYHAEDPSEEFIELKNIGAEAINLNLVSFADGIDFTFPSLDLAAGEYVVVVRSRGAFEARYGATVNIAGQYSGSLNNAGERITLEDAMRRTMLDFVYRDGWRSITDGEGFSLTVIDPANPDPGSWNEKDSWRASVHAGGSPGYDDGGIIPNPGAVVINELLAHSHDAASDWIELHNTTETAIDIDGWFVSDSADNLFKYEIAGGTMIAPGQYLVLHQDLHFGNANNPGSHESFALSENGERIYLSSAQNGVLTGYRDVQDFGPSATGVSLGRYYKTSTGNYNFVSMDQDTPGSANAYPKVGPVVISEIMYNPDWPVGGSYTNNQYEYIELHNAGAEPVTLYRYDKAVPWRFTDGIEFTFDAGVPAAIPAGGYLLVVKNPAAFSSRYPGVPVEMILGPYNGSLSNVGEKLELAIPGDVGASGERLYIRVDRVNYSDGSPPGPADLWPGEADGKGKSLTRKTPTDYGNDPGNWIASAPSPGQ